MSIRFSAKNLERVKKYIRKYGSKQPSERGDTYEVVGAHLVLDNVLDRIDTNRWRKMNFAFAIGEWLAMMNGWDSIEYFTKFIKSYSEYSSDGKFLDGAYGPRIWSYGFAVDEVIDKLRMKNETRRAVIPVYSPKDLFGAGGKNTPCTLSFQFLIRDGKLHMVTNMRSNDIDYGLTNDVVVFTMLHEYVANRVDVETGLYNHMVGSLHYYVDIDAKFEAARSAAHEGRWPRYMMPMNGALNDPIEMSRLSAFYRDITDTKIPPSWVALKTQYAKNLALAAICFIHRNNSNGVDAYYNISDPTIKRVMRPWLKTKESE